MNLADTIAADLARHIIAQSQPTRKHKNGLRCGGVVQYSPEARARKKRQREARKRNRRD